MNKSKKITDYLNGNCRVQLYDDGTRIIETDEDNFKFDFPLSFDCKITNNCPYMCKFCHEDSRPDGEHGDILNLEFFKTLKPGTEIAIGGGAITKHPDLVPFLKNLKKQGIIANTTINQREYSDNKKLIDYLIKENLIYGLGVSFVNPSDELKELVQNYRNTVIHTIAGLITLDNLEWLSNIHAKVLILGYKDLRRGHCLLEKESEKIEKNISLLKDNLFNYKGFKTISFDNLALKQLSVKEKLPPEFWETFYQGDDGNSTMFIDCVKKEFAKMSTSKERFPIEDSIKTMFEKIRT